MSNLINLPIGRDDFREIIDNNLDFVDKSLLIAEMFHALPTQKPAIIRF